jgi:hypothetical protein
VRTTRWLAICAACVALALSAAAVSGCCGIPGVTLPSKPPATNGPTEEGPPLEGTGSDVTEPPAESASVVVPDVLGKYYDEAAAAITAAGLNPVDVSIHGPIDEDAGDIGTIYRQTPKAGESVPAGTKVELRSWWESQ